MQSTMAGWATKIIDAFHGVIQWITSAWSGFMDWFIEKTTLAASMLKGMSPDQAGADVKKNQESAHAASNSLMAGLKDGAVAAKAILGATWDDAKKNIGQSWDAGVGVLKNALGPLWDKLFGGLDKFLGPGSELPKVGPSIKEALGKLTSLAALTSGAPLKPTVAQDLGAGTAMSKSFGGGDKGDAAAAQFFSHMEVLSGLSAETMNTVTMNLHRVMTDAAAAGMEGTILKQGLAQGVSDMVASFKGLPDSTITAMAALNDGNLAAVQDLAAATVGMTEAQVNAIVAATGGSVAAIETMSADFKKIPAASATAAAQASSVASEYGAKYYGFVRKMGDGFDDMRSTFDRVTSKMHQALDDVGEGAASFGAQVLQKGGGQAASVTQGAVQGFALGGPIGAVGGAIGAVASASEALGPIMDRLSSIIMKMAVPFDGLFQAIGPMIDALMPIFNAIVGLFSTVIKGLKPVFDLLTTILKALAPIIAVFVNVIGDIIGQLFKALEPIIEAIMPIVAVIGDILGQLAPLLNILTVAMQPTLMPIKLVGYLFKALTPVITFVGKVLSGLTGVVMAIFGALAKVWNMIVGVIVWVFNQLGKLPDWLGGEWFAKTAKDMEENWKINLNKNKADNTDISEPDPAAADATNAQNNNAVVATTSNIKSMGDTAAKVSQQLANAPSGFSIALARFQTLVGAPKLAANAQFGGGSSSALALRQVTNNVTIVSNDPARIYGQLKALEDQQNFLNTGSPLTSATPLVGGSKI